MFSRLRTVIALMRNPRVSNLPKFLVIGAILYILWPADVLPDIAPIVGWLDDLAFLIGALTLLFGARPKGDASTPSSSPTAGNPVPKGPVIDVTPEPRTPGAQR